MTVAYDVIWCAPEHAMRAMGLLRQLTHTEIILRGIDGMHGLRVNPKAPMPRDSYGTYCGDIGVCVMPNWLGSEAISNRMGEVMTPQNDEFQHVNLAPICRTIEILERGERGETILAGGLFAHGIEDSPDVVRCIAIQAKREQHTREQSEAIDAGFFEVLSAKVILLAAGSIMRPLKNMSEALWRRWILRPLALPAYACLALAGLVLYGPTMAYLYACARARKVQRLARLALPFDPYLEAMQVLPSRARYRS
jgi:hypothetical protein